MAMVLSTILILSALGVAPSASAQSPGGGVPLQVLESDYATAVLKYQPPATEYEYGTYTVTWSLTPAGGLLIDDVLAEEPKDSVAMVSNGFSIVTVLYDDIGPLACFTTNNEQPTSAFGGLPSGEMTLVPGQCNQVGTPRASQGSIMWKVVLDYQASWKVDDATWEKVLYTAVGGAGAGAVGLACAGITSGIGAAGCAVLGGAAMGAITGFLLSCDEGGADCVKGASANLLYGTMGVVHPVAIDVSFCGLGSGHDTWDYLEEQFWRQPPNQPGFSAPYNAGHTCLNIFAVDAIGGVTGSVNTEEGGDSVLTEYWLPEPEITRQEGTGKSMKALEPVSAEPWQVDYKIVLDPTSVEIPVDATIMMYLQMDWDYQYANEPLRQAGRTQNQGFYSATNAASLEVAGTPTAASLLGQQIHWTGASIIEIGSTSSNAKFQLPVDSEDDNDSAGEEDCLSTESDSAIGMDYAANGFIIIDPCRVETPDLNGLFTTTNVMTGNGIANGVYAKSTDADVQSYDVTFDLLPMLYCGSEYCWSDDIPDAGSAVAIIADDDDFGTAKEKLEAWAGTENVMFMQLYYDSRTPNPLFSWEEYLGQHGIQSIGASALPANGAASAFNAYQGSDMPLIVPVIVNEPWIAPIS